MPPMRRSLVACVALFLGCNPAQPGPEQGTGTTKKAPAKAADAKKPAEPDAKAKATDAKVLDTKTKAEPDKPAEPDVKVAPIPAPPAVKLEAATTELLDRLVPAADRVAVDDAAAKALTITATDSDLGVGDGSRRASLHQRASTVLGVTIQTDTSGEPVLHIGFQDDAFCGEIVPQYVDLSARTLLARLEQASGEEQHGKRDFAAAAKSFARAALLDPSLDEPWLGLAKALAKQSDAAGAMAALDPVIRRAPLATYHQVLSDADLASLREQPAIVALRAPKAGDVKIRKMTIAYSTDKSLVALIRKEDSWGACNYVQELRLHSTASGEKMLSLPLADFSETDPECPKKAGPGKVLPAHRATVNARFDAAERFLRDMGFSVSAGLELVDPPKVAGEDYIKKATLPGAGLEIEIDEGNAVVRKGTEVLVDRPQTLAQSIDLIGYDPAANVAFIEWYGQVPEGCAFDDDGRAYYVFPIPAAK